GPRDARNERSRKRWSRAQLWRMRFLYRSSPQASSENFRNRRKFCSRALTCCFYTSNQRDCRNEPAVVLLSAMHAAPVGKTAFLIGVSADANILERGDARLGHPHLDEGRQVEHRMARLRRGGKKAMKPGILGYEAFDEFGPDLIASGVDHRSERDANFAA